MSSLIGNRYGEAFFEAGRDENCLDSLYDDVRLLEGVLEDNDDFMKIMTVPSIPKEEQSRLLDTIFEGSLQPLTLNYLHLLVDKNRFGGLQDSLGKFIELYREYKGIVCAVAITAVPMSEELTGRLQEKLAAVTGKQVELTCEVDPSLISGIRLQMNGEQFDGSVRRRLDNLKKSMESAVF